MVRLIFAFTDLVVLNLIFLTGLSQIVGVSLDAYKEYTYFWIFSNTVWLAVCWLNSLYQGRMTAKFERYFKRTIQVFIIYLFILLFYLLFARQPILSRFFILFFLLLFPLSLLVVRILYLLVSMHFRKKDYLIRRILIIGYNDVSKKLAEHFENAGSQVEVVGYCEEPLNVNELSHYPIIAPPADAVLTGAQLHVSEIYSTILPEHNSSIYDLMHLADEACIRFRLVPDFSFLVNRPMHISYLSGIAVLSPRWEPLDDLANRIRKRLLDLIVSVTMLVFVLSWLVPLLALLIKLESKGPVFFVQSRTGINNKPFSCYKFRSMRMNKNAHLLQATKNDSRLTGMGKFLRKTNLDEFPQFFNVLKGDMSVVGPRPHMIKHTEDYSPIVEKYMVRQFLKPGITGWAQINGHRGETRTTDQMQARVNHDIWYLENWSLFLDLKIIFLTFFNMLKGEKNAY